MRLYSRKFVSEQLCDFSPPDPSRHACRLPWILAENLSSGARSCSNAATLEEAEPCFAAAIADGVDGFWSSDDEPQFDSPYQNGVIARVTGRMEEFHYDASGSETTTTRWSCKNIDDPQWSSCPGSTEPQVLCRAPWRTDP